MSAKTTSRIFLKNLFLCGEIFSTIINDFSVSTRKEIFSSRRVTETEVGFSWNRNREKNTVGFWGLSQFLLRDSRIFLEPSCTFFILDILVSTSLLNKVANISRIRECGQLFSSFILRGMLVPMRNNSQFWRYFNFSFNAFLFSHCPPRTIMTGLLHWKNKFQTQ